MMVDAGPREGGEGVIVVAVAVAAARCMVVCVGKVRFLFGGWLDVLYLIIGGIGFECKWVGRGWTDFGWRTTEGSFMARRLSPI